ncbi:MAG: DUF1330 domain-containing protein [Rhodobacteraceae bacterium]|nr:DUF1330 domain-containing protein [Paracoccaceae bacterium]
MPKGYWIAHITVTDPESYPEYVARDTPIIEGMGGTFIVRGGTAELREGSTQQRHVVVEFPSFEMAKAAYESEEYQEVAKIRYAAAESTFILVEGT